MINAYVWIFLLILQCVLVSPRPVHDQKQVTPKYDYNTQSIPKYDNTGYPRDEQVISVRITSSVAVGRRKGKHIENNPETTNENGHDESFLATDATTVISNTENVSNIEELEIATDIPPSLIGANIEFIKQLNAKKELHGILNEENIHPFQLNAMKHSEEFHSHNFDSKSISGFESHKDNYNDDYNFNHNDYKLNTKNRNYSEDTILKPHYDINSEISTINENVPLARSVTSLNSDLTKKKKDIIIPDSYQYQIQQNLNHNESEDSIAESSIKSVLEIQDKNNKNIDNIPIARAVSISSSSNNYIQGLTNKPLDEIGNSASLTTVSFNIVHDVPNQNNYNELRNANRNPNIDQENVQKFFDPPTIYSQPAKVYSEPAKFYSEPAKVYSEPAKIYSEPAKIYSEPAKIYSEPAKFYSQPASLHLSPSVPPTYTPWQPTPQKLDTASTSNTTPITTNTKIPSGVMNIQSVPEHQPEKNYEIDEKISVLSEGRIHGIQETTTEKCKQDNCKVGYVVEGRQYKKYRVEERTSDGFIVGEYGVVRNEDGALRGVRYTADSDASPRLIYDALMKFLQLK
ncbi:probable serine/threonine-protein kinase clkA [Galleria mellonella]|uniref:Probable serine/threonine-protein kinase clkA n=1 Tax=Galleria mellonella TaxID=7137 RepID=A0A6J1WME1_GALME|nr:probable serine/threonine-protein kinase clkA [Galleria mellonella]